MPGHSRRLVWSPTAERDLADIWNYLVTHASIEVADAQVRLISNRCISLQRHPFRGRTRDDLMAGLRGVLANPYIIFYRVTEDSVEIMHILHGCRNLPAIVSREID